jgi:hypothetical protein
MVGVWSIALLFTGWKHAGENLGEVLNGQCHCSILPPTGHEIRDGNGFTFEIQYLIRGLGLTSGVGHQSCSCPLRAASVVCRLS